MTCILHVIFKIDIVPFSKSKFFQCNGEVGLSFIMSVNEYAQYPKKEVIVSFINQQSWFDYCRAECRLYYCNGPRHNLNTVCPPLPYEEEAEANKILQHAMSCLLDHFGYQDYLFSLLSFTVTTATLGYNSTFS